MKILAIRTNNQLSTFKINKAGAAFIAGTTAFLIGCVSIFHDDKEIPKAKLITDIVSAGYATWLWQMGLAPEPCQNNG